MTDTAATPAVTTRTLDDAGKARVRTSFERLRASFPNYRPRPAQNAMVGAVARALGTTGGRAVLEGPTGVGKSIAYMLGGVPLALESGKTLVLSTASVALQQQIAYRDLPAFLTSTGLSANVVLAKGRGRFACPRNMSELVATNGPVQDDLLGEFGSAGWSRPPKEGEARLVADLAEALIGGGAWDGDIDNPPGGVAIPGELKPLITTTAGACSGRKCPFAGACPALKLREKLKEADIIVANHDLVLRSLMQHEQGGGQPNFLSDPSESLYVIDEAHTLFDKSIDAGAAMVHLPSALVRLPKMKAATAAVFRAIGDNEVGGLRLEQVHTLLGQLVEITNTIRNHIQLEWRPGQGERTPIWRAPMGRLPDEWRQLSHEARRASGELVRWLEKARSGMREAEVSDVMRDRAMRELGAAAEHVSAYFELWSMWATEDLPGMAPTARWISLGTDQGVICHASSVSAADFLQRHLWEHADGVVMTSATLSAGGDFSLLAESCGIPDTAEFVSLPSPFDLHNQAVLQVPRFPVMPDDPEHPKAIIDWITTYLDWSKSGLVLFTSKRKMEACVALLPERFRALVRVQGERPLQVLLTEHAAAIDKGIGSVLFGMMSLGEGLDLRGKLLEQVVITQLPFTVPAEPVSATRAEWYESMGRNPFVEIAVPEALRTLTQFCGRLIRTETDIGSLYVLDRRLVTKRYGRTILQGLPPFRQDIVR